MQSTSTPRVWQRAWQACSVIFGLLLMSSSIGCSINKAITQPEKKDLGILMPGHSRAEVIAELGKPSYEETNSEGQRDVFTFKQGYTKPVKVARAVGHGVGLISTFGLWELAGYPIELALNGEEVKVMVDYDHTMTVSEVTYLTGAHLRKNGPTLPAELYGVNEDGDADVVRLSRGAGGELVVTRGVPPPKTRDETRVAASPKVEEVNEATYYSSNEREGSIRASTTSGTKLR